MISPVPNPPCDVKDIGGFKAVTKITGGCTECGGSGKCGVRMG